MEAGLGQWTFGNSQPTGGRPSETFELGTPLCEDRTTTGDSESRGFGTVDAVDTLENEIDAETVK